MQIEGPYPVQKLGNGQEVTYLKKSYLFSESGLYVRPNSKYIESLLALYDLHGRKEKQVPDHSLLCQVDASEDLDGPRQAKFRSGLGIAMYLAHDKVDIQFCVKTLASWMMSPTVQAEKALIQLILYLSGTRDFAFQVQEILLFTCRTVRLVQRWCTSCTVSMSTHGQRFIAWRCTVTQIGPVVRSGGQLHR